MTDLSLTIAPKSDQLNADDLIPGPLTIKITKVSANPSSAEQPISIFFDGDGGKPYLPCKSMRRVLVQVWGRDGNTYPGRSMTLYRDPQVQFGGLAVGGIRISHMSDIDKSVTMALTATRANRKPFTVQPLKIERQEPKKQGIREWLDALEAELTGAMTREEAAAIRGRDQVKKAQQSLKNGALERLEKILSDADMRPWDDGSLPPLEDGELPTIENDPALSQQGDGWPGPDTKAAA